MKTTALFAVAAILAAPSTTTAQAASERSDRPTDVSGVVFEDLDGDGSRDSGEPGLEGVAVSDQVVVVTTDPDGRFEFSSRGYGVVSVASPGTHRPSGASWLSLSGDTGDLAFPLEPTTTPDTFTFIHASDPHISDASVDRFRRFRQLVDSLQPAFVVITGDLVRDALRVSEDEARGYYELLVSELAQMTVPVHVVPGNHEKFGIERHQSGVSPDHPLYGNRMYRHYLGPNYYAFSYGGVRFLGLDSVDYDDQWYHGHIDQLQLEWIRAEVARGPADEPIVTFNHIPFVSGGAARGGYRSDGVAPSTIEIDGATVYRHNVYNHEDVLTEIGDRLEIALGGHIHMAERLAYRTQAGMQRLHQTAAIVGPAPGATNDYGPVSGFTIYRVNDGRVDEGEFVVLR